MFMATDGGQSFAGMMARAAPSVRSQGVFHAVRSYGEQIMLEMLPNANCMRAVPTNIKHWLPKIRDDELPMHFPTTKVS